MKEATGELNMTVITVVAIMAIGGLFYAFIWPMIKQRLVQTTCDTMGYGWTASSGEQCQNADSSSGRGCTVTETDEAGGAEWCCCPPED